MRPAGDGTRRQAGGNLPAPAGLLLSFLPSLLLATLCGCMDASRGKAGQAPDAYPARAADSLKGGRFDFSRMNLTEKPDFIELQVLGTVAFLGDSCASRPDGKCVRKLERLRPEEGFHAHCALSPCWNFIRAEVGGRGKAWGSTEDIRTLLGSIDTEEEAKLWLFVNGFNVVNDDSLRVEAAGTGYRVRAARTEGCPLVRSLHEVEVDSTGGIRETSSRVLETFNACY